MGLDYSTKTKSLMARDIGKLMYKKRMIFGPNGESIMTPMEHSPMVCSLNEKGMVL